MHYEYCSDQVGLLRIFLQIDFQTVRRLSATYTSHLLVVTRSSGILQCVKTFLAPLLEYNKTKLL